MAERFGDRASFAIEVGPHQSPDLRTVDLWAGSQRLTRDDNCAFIPCIVLTMQSAASQILHRKLPGCPFPDRTPQEIFQLLHADDSEFRESFWFLQWGEIVDNVELYAYLDDLLVLMFQFWREPVTRVTRRKTFVAAMQPDEFVTTVQAAIEMIRSDPI